MWGSVPRNQPKGTPLAVEVISRLVPAASRWKDGPMESDEEAALLGRIAVRHNFITLEQLAEVTRERGRAGKKLGVIMLEKGFIDEFGLGKILALQQRHKANLEKKKKEDAKRRRPHERKRVPTPRDWVFITPPEDPAIPPRKLDRDTPSGPIAARPSAPSLDLSDDDEEPVPSRPAMAPDAPSRASPFGHTRPGGSSRSARSRLPRRDAITAPDGPLGSRFDDDPEVEVRPTRPSPRSERPTAPSRPKITEEEVKAALEGRIADEATHEDEPLKDRETMPDSEVPPSAPQRSRLTDIDPRRVAEELSTEPPSGGYSEPPPESSLEPRPLTKASLPPPSVQNLHTILAHAADAQASDVHVSPGQVVKMRQFGRLVPLTDAPLAPEATERVLRAMLNAWQLRRLDEEGQVDLAYSVVGVGRFRANIYRQLRGYTGVFHHVPAQVPTLSQLGLPTSLAKLTNYSQGLILLTGPAGCGKTSTLAALVHILNEERRDHILTIEDPIEYIHRSQRCIVNQRQVGRHTTSFAAALRGALREDPDVICIGELRDLETISLALSAAETGHLVLATLHTSSAIGTVNRIVGAYPPSQQSQVRAMMSESLRAVISQRLLPTSDGQGVLPALEILYVTKAIGSMIRENRTFQIRSSLQTGKAQGMQLMDTAVAELFRAGRISRDVAVANSEDQRGLS